MWTDDAHYDIVLSNLICKLGRENFHSQCVGLSENKSVHKKSRVFENKFATKEVTPTRFFSYWESSLNDFASYSN